MVNEKEEGNIDRLKNENFASKVNVLLLIPSTYH